MVCGRVARRQKFYLEPSIVTAVGLSRRSRKTETEGFFILRFSRRILCLAAMLARSSTVGGLSSEALAKEDPSLCVLQNTNCIHDNSQNFHVARHKKFGSFNAVLLSLESECPGSAVAPPSFQESGLLACPP